MDRRDYKRIVIQWKEFQVPKVLERHVSVPLNHDFIVTISGPRRSGKTYFCFQLMQKLHQDGLPQENIFYVNFEDEKLLGATASDLESLLEAYQELISVDTRREIYLFLDEIQNVEHWDVWVRRVSDLFKNIHLVLTGSSSKMLSREISTRLRGRVINQEMYPLSFIEYCSWRGLTYSVKTLLASQERILVKKAFQEYLHAGGFPALMTHDLPREMILQEYYRSMILKDVIERYGVKFSKQLELLAKLIFESVTKEITYSKLSHKLSSLGMKLSKNTIIEYVSYFEEAYLFFQNIKYEYSLTKQLGSVKKVYCVDNGLLNAMSFQFSENMGKLMENVTYMELKRRGYNVYFHKDKRECDFLITEKNRVALAIQVTSQLSEHNQKREYEGLLEAMKTHNLKDGILLTEDQQNEENIQGYKILTYPLWYWLLMD